jgi:hypothetical protein
VAEFVDATFVNPLVISPVVLIKSYESSRNNQVVEECPQPGPGPARMAEIVRMRSFASPAARVLRSVRSRWQTRLAQRTRALATIIRSTITR